MDGEEFFGRGECMVGHEGGLIGEELREEGEDERCNFSDCFRAAFSFCL